MIGDPDAVAAGLEELVERTGADELIVTTRVHRLEDRARSLKLASTLV